MDAEKEFAKQFNLEEIRLLKLLYNVIMDKTVQRRFETTTTCDMTTGKLSNKMKELLQEGDK